MEDFVKIYEKVQDDNNDSICQPKHGTDQV